MIKNRLKKNLQRLKSSGVLNETNAFRIYDRDIPEYPFMVDVYGEYIVIHDRRNLKIDSEKPNLIEIKDAIRDLFPDAKNVFTKHRKNQERFNKYQKMSKQSLITTVQENGLNFSINLTDYIDVGLFLDHRPLRRWCKKQSKGKRVLNLFSYTCAISVACAAGEAESVTSVDLSQKYLDWGEKNFLLNDIDPSSHDFIQGDILKTLPTIKKESFDLIICDPPTFSNSKKMTDTFDVQQSHTFLIDECLEKLTSKGKLYFSCNKRDFKLDAKYLNNESITLSNLSQKSIPADFKDPKIHQCFLFEKIS